MTNKQPRKLTGSECEQLQQALRSAFPTPDDLKQMVRFELDEGLDHIAGGQNLSNIVFGLIGWAEAQGRMDALIQGAYRRNPGNPKLQTFMQKVYPNLFPSPQEPPEDTIFVPREFPSQPSVSLPDHPLENEKQPLRIFLCYAHEDKDVVLKLHKRLQSAGFHPWMDEKNLLPGQDWQTEIRKAVHESQVFLACISHQSVTKTGFVNREIAFALDVAEEQTEGTIFVIPVRLDESKVPERLRRWHWCNYFEKDGYERLMDALFERSRHFGIPREDWDRSRRLVREKILFAQFIQIISGLSGGMLASVFVFAVMGSIGIVLSGLLLVAFVMVMMKSKSTKIPRLVVVFLLLGFIFMSLYTLLGIQHIFFQPSNPDILIS